VTESREAHTGRRLRAALLCAVGAFLLFVPPASAQDEDPVRLRVEAYSFSNSFVHLRPGDQWLGFNAEWLSPSILEARVEKGHWRIGVALEQDVLGLMLVQSYAPLHVEYIVWERPIWYAWVLHGMVPEVTVRLTGYWLNSTMADYLKVPAAGRLDAIVGTDFWGVGLSLSAGVVAIYTKTGGGRHPWLSHTGISPNVEFRFRLLTLGADLSPRN
jgi:hypothetical protein